MAFKLCQVILIVLASRQDYLAIHGGSVLPTKKQIKMDNNYWDVFKQCTASVNLPFQNLCEVVC